MVNKKNIKLKWHVTKLIVKVLMLPIYIVKLVLSHILFIYLSFWISTIFSREFINYEKNGDF